MLPKEIELGSLLRALLTSISSVRPTPQKLILVLVNFVHRLVALTVRVRAQLSHSAQPIFRELSIPHWSLSSYALHRLRSVHQFRPPPFDSWRVRSKLLRSKSLAGWQDLVYRTIIKLISLYPQPLGPWSNNEKDI